MSLIVALLLAILFGLYGFLSPASVARVDSSFGQMTGETLIVDGEDIVRLALTTPNAADAYVASADSLYRASEGSEGWTRVAEAPPAGHLAFDAQAPDVLMVGDAGACARGDGGAALQVSTDGGLTWTGATDGPQVRPLAIASEAGLVAGAACEGFMISTDLGATWHVVDNRLLGLEVTAFAVIEGEQHAVLVGLTGEGGTTRLFRIDLADPASPQVSPPLREYYGLGGVAATSDAWYLASIAGVAVSTDRGATWSVDRTGLEDVTVAEDPAIAGLPPDFDYERYGLYAIQLRKGEPWLLGAQTGAYQHLAAGWEPLVLPGSRFLAFEPVPGGDGVLAQGQDFVWVVYPAP